VGQLQGEVPRFVSKVVVKYVAVALLIVWATCVQCAPEDLAYAAFFGKAIEIIYQKVEKTHQ
jgi:hypothetical protein